MKKTGIGKRWRQLVIMAIMSGLLTLLFLGPVSAATIELCIGNQQASVDGKTVWLEAGPYTSNGRTMVPLRMIAEGFGATVKAFQSDSDVVALIDYRNLTLHLKSGSQVANIIDESGERSVQMDVAAEIVNDRMFVPVRFIAETFGATVTWNEQTQTITIINGSQPGSSPSTDLTQAATYLPDPGMKLHYTENYEDGPYKATLYTRGPQEGSGYLLDFSELSDGSGETPDYSHHYIADDDGIYEFYSTDSGEKPVQIPWLKNGLHKGLTWSFSHLDSSMVWEVQAVDQTVTVGSHIIDHCLVVKEDNQAVGWVFLKYYAPGLGLVRSESPPGGNLTALLETWE